MNNSCVTLRDYQLEIKTRLFEAWRSHQSVMVQMPTGTGKTHVLAFVIRNFILENKLVTPSGVWIVAHRRELVEQAEETLGKYGIEKTDGRVKVISIQWLTRHWEDMGGQPSLIVIDEAHHAQARTYRMLWEHYPTAKFLGLTATPCRMNRRGFTDLFDTLICSWSIAEFIKKGRLSPFDYVSIRHDSEEQRLIDSLEKRGADGDYQLKEMDYVLNRQQRIGKLYESIQTFAHNKKGIVYAISIDHARNIADYYNNKGVNAVAIDSKTPIAERKRMVEDFKSGKTSILVNVDVFSEGFDCPDVEFVQLARPTLSLAKYLQQVGRGLRKSEGKETCMLIDNVGLYRVFGLPVTAWDWEAMFKGSVAGKGYTIRQAGRMSHPDNPPQKKRTGQDEMELVISHNRLLETLSEIDNPYPAQPVKNYGLKVWQDGENELWGLKRNREHLTEAQFVTVFDTGYDMAAVRFKDMSCGLVDESGKTIWKKGRFQSMKFLKNHLLNAVSPDGKEYYMDLYNLRMYDKKPEIKKYGNIELLKTDHGHYSRTKTVYINNQSINERYIVHGRFYLAVLDCKVPFSALKDYHDTSGYSCGYACILEDDHDSYYWLYRKLEDGSILIKDTKGSFYQAKEGKGKTYIGNDRSEQGRKQCLEEMKRLVREAKVFEMEKKKQQRESLNETDNAIPFKSGLKWGLKVGNRITVPPIYRNIKPPVGKYCVVEKNYSQWGVIAIDGTILIEPKYPEVSIENNDTALLTSVTGKIFSVKL